MKLLVFFTTLYIAVARAQPQQQQDTLIRDGDLVTFSLWHIDAPNAQVKNLLPKGKWLTTTDAIAKATIFKLTLLRTKTKQSSITTGSEVTLQATYNRSQTICFASPRLTCISQNATSNATNTVFTILDKHTRPTHNLAHGDYIKIRLRNSQIDCNTELKSLYINCRQKSNDPYSYGFVILKDALLRR